LEAIDLALTQLITVAPESAYFRQLSKQVQRTLDKNRTLANNVKEAHQWLRQIAACLRYPRRSFSDDPINRRQVAKEMQELLNRFAPDPKYQRPQSALQYKLERTWNLYGPDLLHTYTDVMESQANYADCEWRDDWQLACFTCLNDSNRRASSCSPSIGVCSET